MNIDPPCAVYLVVSETGDLPMITVTRLNGQRFVVNAELIRTVESNPDTTIKLVNGDILIVCESMEQVVELSIEYGRSLRGLLPPS